MKRIGDEVWSHDGNVNVGPGSFMRMPCRATIMRLPSGELVIHSPIAIDEAAAREIDALGDVRFLVAPNCMHWMFLKAAKERYPKARVLAAPGLAKKLGAFEFEPLPERGAIEGLRGLEVERILGAPAIEEHVFLHEASRSLVVTELVFNLHEVDNFGMRLFLRLGGAWKRMAQSRAWRMLVKDRPAAARSALDILAWDFERVVVAHGDVIEEDARERMRQALGWMTSAARPQLGAGSPV
jgi:hypothetical protein